MYTVHICYRFQLYTLYIYCCLYISCTYVYRKNGFWRKERKGTISFAAMHACMRILIPMLLQITIQKIELVKGMGVLIKSSSLAMILRRSKRTPTRLLRFLMGDLFSVDELQTSTVHGKKGKLPGLDQGTMDAILCKCLIIMLSTIFYITV